MEDAVCRVLAYPDLLEHLAIGRENGHSVRDRRAYEQPSVGGKRHPVRNVIVGELAERGGLPFLESAHAVSHRLRPVQPLLSVESDAVRIHARQLKKHLAVAAAVDREQPARRTHVEAEVLLRAGIGEVEPSVGSEGQVVWTE